MPLSSSSPSLRLKASSLRNMARGAERRARDAVCARRGRAGARTNGHHEPSTVEILPRSRRSVGRLALPPHRICRDGPAIRSVDIANFSHLQIHQLRGSTRERSLFVNATPAIMEKKAPRTVKDVPSQEFVVALAQYFRSTGKVRVQDTRNGKLRAWLRTRETGAPGGCGEGRSERAAFGALAGVRMRPRGRCDVEGVVSDAGIRSARRSRPCEPARDCGGPCRRDLFRVARFPRGARCGAVPGVVQGVRRGMRSQGMRVGPCWSSGARGVRRRTQECIIRRLSC